MSETRPSEWIRRFEHLLPRPASPDARAAEILDFACGSGRHARFLLGRGHLVRGVDVDVSRVADLEGEPGFCVECHDLENGPWPFAGRRFTGIVVTNYLWRPRLHDLLAAIAPGGCLLYETFMRGHERHGRPRRAEFLLEPHELFERVRAADGMQVIAFEQGSIHATSLGGPAIVQRIAAIRDADCRALAVAEHAAAPDQCE